MSISAFEEDQEKQSVEWAGNRNVGGKLPANTGKARKGIVTYFGIGTRKR